MISNIWILICKKLNGEASPEELHELEQLIKLDEKGTYPIDELEYLWKNIPDDTAAVPGPTAEKWEKIEARLNDIVEPQIQDASLEPPLTSRVKLNFSKINKTIMLLAASLLIIMYVFYLTNMPANEDERKTEISAPIGAISKIQLPDGSKVLLNSGSKIVYKNSFNSRFREVYLSGEAYFDVVKDARHPFIVTTSIIRIKVLGTKFNVKSYLNDRTSEATLLKGSIELTVLKNPGRQIMLKPSEKLTIKNTLPQPYKSNVAKELIPAVVLSQVHQTSRDTLPSEVLWIDDEIVFDAMEFEDIAKMMERKYNVSILFKNEDTKKLKFTGKFKNEPINKALNALQITTNFNFKLNDNQVVIY